MLAGLIEFRTIFQQDENFVVVLKLPKDMLMPKATEYVLLSVWDGTIILAWVRD